MAESLLSKLRDGLSKTRARLVNQIEEVITFHQKISPELFEELEEVLVSADVGIETTDKLLEKLKLKLKEKKTESTDQIKQLLKDIIIEMLSVNPPGDLEKPPLAILVVGVNGVGKTTSIAKLTEYYRNTGRSCLLAAGDTFRAGAIAQIKVWGQRLGVDVIYHQEGADPGAVAFDGIAAANARKIDVLIIDTAGRLHTKVNLMSELKKVHRIVAKNAGQRRLVNLIVLDATTGQNALTQAQTFREAVGLDGVILTKLDGTAKGGIVLAVTDQLQLPIVWIGTGEKPEDLRPFDPREFAEALFG